MHLKHHDIDIPDDYPFKNCKLDREKYAYALTDIISGITKGFVLAINNDWGTGKTTFIKMWKRHLEKNKYQTLYFNAWETDNETSPLAALLAELKKLFPKSSEKKFKSILDKAAIFTQNVIPALVKGVSKRYIDSDAITDGLENATKAATEILKDEIEKYTARQKGMKEFQVELEKQISEIDPKKPIIFFIDELDRCRPNYAVEVLEWIKHFFTVPGIVFILSIDKNQLGHAVKGVYGSEGINSEEYLRRFIDLEYSLPNPTPKVFCDYLYTYYSFEDFFSSPNRTQFSELRNDRSDFLTFASFLFDTKNITLRQQEKIFAHARLALRSFNSNQYVFPTAYILLIYLHSFHKEIFSDIKRRKLTPNKLVELLESLFTRNFTDQELRTFVYTEALIVLLYTNYYREIYHDVKIINNEGFLLIKSKLSESDLLRFLNHLRDKTFNDAKLDFLLTKIELIEEISNRE